MNTVTAQATTSPRLAALRHEDVLTGYRGVRTIVLGASGFIGQWVVRYLHALDAEVYPLMRDAGRAPALFPAEELRARTIAADVLDLAALRTHMTAAGPAIIFNLAGYGVDPTERDPFLAEHINARLPAALCDWLAGWNAPGWSGQRLIHVGSAAEYGAAAGDLREDTPARPTTLYGRTKLAGTQQVLECCAARQLRGLTARLFTVYGPGEHAGRLLPSLLACARTGEPLPLTAGLQQRDFTYVEDVAEGLLRLGLVHAAPGEVANLATGRLTAVRTFIETAAEILRIPADRLQFGALPARPDEMQHNPVNVTTLYARTGWRPDTGIYEGICNTVALT